MGTFYIVLLRVYPSTYVPIFIEIGLYLTDTEHEIGWHSFFRHGLYKTSRNDNASIFSQHGVVMH